MICDLLVTTFTLYAVAVIAFAMGFGVCALLTAGRDDRHDEHEEFPGC